MTLSLEAGGITVAEQTMATRDRCEEDEED